MNRVYLVRERAGGQLRALKQTDGKDKRKLACLRKEASFLSTVRHPLIPACIRVIDEEGSFALLMEYVLLELDVRKTYDVIVVGIKMGDKVEVNPDPKEQLKEGNVLILIGSNQALEAIQ